MVKQEISQRKASVLETDDNRRDGGTIALSSSHSTQVSLDKVKYGKAGLNKHRQSLLDKVSEQNQWARFELGSLEMEDLAYLTAKTGDEFTILRSKKDDILYHGTPTRCDVLKDEDLEPLVMSHKYEVIGHSHPAELFPDPSADDRQFLRYIGQKRSKLISGMTGICIEFEEIL